MDGSKTLAELAVVVTTEFVVVAPCPTVPLWVVGATDKSKGIIIMLVYTHVHIFSSALYTITTGISNRQEGGLRGVCSETPPLCSRFYPEISLLWLITGHIL